MLTVLVGCALSAVGSALPGALALQWAFGIPAWRGGLMWLSSEMYDMLVFLPLVLAAPRGRVASIVHLGRQPHQLTPPPDANLSREAEAPGSALPTAGKARPPAPSARHCWGSHTPTMLEAFASLMSRSMSAAI